MDLRDFREFLIDASKYIIVIVVVLLVALFVISFQQVVGPSMESTFYEGDVVLVNKLAYKLGSPKRGDVVTLSINEKIMIKRIIGLPGETVSYKDGKLYIDGKAYEDKWAKSNTDDFEFSDITDEEVIPDGYYLVLGDNRADSMDSRSYGLVSKKDLVGRVAFRVYPFNKMKAF